MDGGVSFLGGGVEAWPRWREAGGGRGVQPTSLRDVGHLAIGTTRQFLTLFSSDVEGEDIVPGLKEVWNPRLILCVCFDG